MSYSKQTFKDGQVLKAHDLNLISDGLSTVNDAIDGYNLQNEDYSIDVTNFETKNGVALYNEGTIIANNTRLYALLPNYDATQIVVNIKEGYLYNIVFYNDFVDESSAPTHYIQALGMDWQTTNAVRSIPTGCKSFAISLRNSANDTIAPCNLGDIIDYIVLKGATGYIGGVKASIKQLTNRVENIENTDKIPMDACYYDGEQIKISPKRNRHPYYRTVYKVLQDPGTHQTMVSYGDYVFFMMFNNNNHNDKNFWAHVSRLSTGEYLGKLIFNPGANKVPHLNCACFGVEFYNGNTELPVLYLSQWWNNNTADTDMSKRGTLVYNIDIEHMTTELVQFIYPEYHNTDYNECEYNKTFGYGAADWVVDTDNLELYSFTYYEPSSAHPSGSFNPNTVSRVCKFKLPSLSDGVEVELTADKILDSYDIPTTNFSQNKVYSDGKVYIACGGNGGSVGKPAGGWQEWCNIRVVDLKKKTQTHCIPIHPISGIQEPEGFDIIDGKLIMSYNVKPYGTLYEWHF